LSSRYLTTKIVNNLPEGIYIGKTKDQEIRLPIEAVSRFLVSPNGNYVVNRIDGLWKILRVDFDEETVQEIVHSRVGFIGFVGKE
jgi:sporulation protein YlmC with PRC-barrel domain